MLILFGSPYVGQLRSSLRSSFPEEYPWIIGGVTATAVVGAIGWAVVHLRQSRYDSSPAPSARQPLWVRYTLIITAVAVSAGYARAVSTGESEVDLVEAFHFVEYGLVAYLFYRAWRRRSDVSGVALAAGAGLALGIADEWVQWFVPGRVGEMHDILLNAVAVGCGLLVSIAVHPPLSLALPTRRQSRLALGAAVRRVAARVCRFCRLRPSRLRSSGRQGGGVSLPIRHDGARGCRSESARALEGVATSGWWFPS
jgi:VanZ family protein